MCWQGHCGAQCWWDAPPGEVGNNWEVPKEQTALPEICNHWRQTYISKIYWWFNKFLLDEIISLCDAYSLRNREFFFDRSPRVFEYILGIYRKGNTSKQNEWKIVKIIFSHYTSASASTKTLSLYSFYLKCSEGELHLPSSVCPRDFLGELEYWGLSALHLGLHFNLVKLQSNVMQNIFTIQRI